MKSKKVFKESSEWWKNAIVDDSYVTKAYYSVGYKKAGDILADKVLEDGFMMDAIFLPMCYCYRHFIELSLKESILYVTRLLNSGCYENIPKEMECDLEKLKTQLVKTHFLEELWKKLEGRIDIAIENRNRNWDEKIKGYIHEFYLIDESSQAFRYPLDKKGETHFKKEGRYDVENIKSCMEEVEGYFAGLDGYVSDLMV